MTLLRAKLERIKHLPALPSSLIRLLSILTDDDASSADIEDVVIVDRAIGMAVLRAANSALFGAAGDVDSLKDAITRLGTKNLLHVALAQQSASLFQNAGAGYGLGENEAWEGALAGAFAAESLAKEHRDCDVGATFTAALLRDCGKIAMDQIVGIDELREVFCSAKDDHDQLELETESFGFTHAEVGAELALLWGLPDDLAEAIRLHHGPSPGDVSTMVNVVYCADYTAAQLGFGIGLDGFSYTVDHALLRSMGFDQERMSMLLAEVALNMREFTELVQEVT